MNGINDIGYLSQRDAHWSEMRIGDSNETVGRKGCLITCLSMLTDYYGCYQDPGQIASNPKNFLDSSVNWTALRFPTFSFRWREGSLYGASKLDMGMIKSYMAGNPDLLERANRAVILEVGNRSHWVLALWPTFDGDFVAIDPWNGKTCEVLKTYQNITGASLFVSWNKEKPAWQGARKPKAPKFN